VVESEGVGVGDENGDWDGRRVVTRGEVDDGNGRARWRDPKVGE
jgi:hypothetical protein